MQSLSKSKVDSRDSRRIPDRATPLAALFELQNNIAAETANPCSSRESMRYVYCLAAPCRRLRIVPPDRNACTRASPTSQPEPPTRSPAPTHDETTSAYDCTPTQRGMAFRALR